MSDHETIKAHLDRAGTRKTPDLPVFAKTSLGVVKLGNAATHEEAEAFGLSQGIRCEKISRGALQGDARSFFILR